LYTENVITINQIIEKRV